MAASREEEEVVRPAGGTVRRLRHERGWGSRHLIDAYTRASLRATGLRETITPHQLAGIEERDERIPYETLCMLAAALDCDPIDILSDRSDEEELDD